MQPLVTARCLASTNNSSTTQIRSLLVGLVTMIVTMHWQAIKQQEQLQTPSHLLPRPGPACSPVMQENRQWQQQHHLLARPGFAMLCPSRPSSSTKACS